MLTLAQQAYFETFGFIVLRQAFTSDEIASITQEFDQALALDRQGKAFSGEKRQGVFAVIERRMPWLVEDSRIYDAIEQLLGPGFVWIGSDSNLYVGDTGWHPDGSMLGYGRIKVAFYLDPVAKDSGCLRVIPGSHKLPLHEDLKPLIEQRKDPSVSPFGVEPRDVPCFPLESHPGDVVLFNQNTWHASFGGQSGRRMFTLNFGAKPEAPEQVDYLQRTYQGNLKNVQQMQHTDTGRVYDDGFLSSDRPRIRGMVAKLVELGFK